MTIINSLLTQTGEDDLGTKTALLINEFGKGSVDAVANIRENESPDMLI